MTANVVALIPSYDRPEILESTLPRWLKFTCINRVFLVAEASSQDILRKYEEIVKKYESTGKLTYALTLGRSGSVKVRNALLDMATRYGCDFAVMTDDDHLIVNQNCITIMVEDCKSDGVIGASGGKIVGVNKCKVDPEFFLNLPINLADPLTKLTSYILLDIRHGPRYSEALTPFFMVRRELLDESRYDEIFSTPTGFREESDLHFQIKQKGYKLFYDPRVYVIHLAAEKGGNRLKITMGQRMYWKARNHTAFVFKWNTSRIKRIWSLALSTLVLMLYRPWHVVSLFRGLREGYGASNRKFVGVDREL